jgi:hypothetical protein
MEEHIPQRPHPVTEQDLRDATDWIVTPHDTDEESKKWKELDLFLMLQEAFLAGLLQERHKND